MYPAVAVIVFLTAIANSQGQGQVHICRGDDLVHAIIRTCSGARSLAEEPEVVLTTTDGRSVDDIGKDDIVKWRIVDKLL